MKLLLCVFLLCLSGFTFGSKAYKINTNFYGQEHSFLVSNESFTVPDCRNVLLQDITQLGEYRWFEIDGIVQIVEGMNFTRESSHYMKGRFTYSTMNGQPNQKVLVHAGSKLTFRGNAVKDRAPILIFRYMDGKKCPNN